MIVIVNNTPIVVDAGEFVMPSFTAGYTASYSNDIELPAIREYLNAFEVDRYKGNSWVNGTAQMGGVTMTARGRWVSVTDTTLTVTLEVSLLPEWATLPINEVINSDWIYNLYTMPRHIGLFTGEFHGGSLSGANVELMTAGAFVADFCEMFAEAVGVSCDATALRTLAPTMCVVPTSFYKTKHTNGTTMMYADNLYTSMLQCFEDTDPDVLTPGIRRWRCVRPCTLTLSFTTYRPDTTAGTMYIEIDKNGVAVYSRVVQQRDFSDIVAVTVNVGDTLNIRYQSAVLSGDFYGKCAVSETPTGDYPFKPTKAMPVLGFPSVSSGYYGGVNSKIGYLGNFDVPFADVANTICYIAGLSVVYTSAGITFAKPEEGAELVSLENIENNFDQLAKKNVLKFSNYAEEEDVPTAGFAEVLTTTNGEEEVAGLTDTLAVLPGVDGGQASVAMFQGVGVGHVPANTEHYFIGTFDGQEIKRTTPTARASRGLIYNFVVKNCNSSYYLHLYGSDFGIIEKRFDSDTELYNIKCVLL